MPELSLQRSYKRFKAIQEANLAYGSKSIEDNSPSSHPYTGGWSLGILLPQQPQIGTKYRCLFISQAVSQEGYEACISYWPENKDPFTQTDLLDSEEDQVQELIYRVKTLLSIPYREYLANKFLTLFNDAKEEDSASLGIAIGSLRNFYHFLQLYPDLKCPTISLTPDYNIYASWRSQQNQVFSVHFLSNGDVRFIIFKTNDRHPERQIRISGTATTDILKEIVSSYGVWDWISE
jgi:hypothetical protein